MIMIFLENILFIAIQTCTVTESMRKHPSTFSTHRNFEAYRWISKTLNYILLTARFTPALKYNKKNWRKKYSKKGFPHKYSQA